VYEGVLGVGIIAHTRPFYFRRCVASLEANTHLENVEFHLFLDGAVNPYSGRRVDNWPGIEEVADIFGRSRLPNRMLHKREWNLGVATNQLQAYDWMTERYPAVVFIEEDTVLSPFALRLFRVMLGQLREREDIFSSSIGFFRCCDEAEIEANLVRMTYGTPHWWAETFWSERWFQVRPYFMEYYELVKDVDYVFRPHDEILALYRRHGWQHTATSQDCGKDMAVWLAGMKRAYPIVNRGLYVGRLGLHSSPAWYDKMKCAEQLPYIFEEDKTLEGFEYP